LKKTPTECQLHYTTCGSYTKFEASGAHLGLKVVINAMAKSDTQHRDLDLAVQLFDQHAFIVKAPNEVFLKISQGVESLTLRHKYSPLYHEDGQHEAGYFTRTSFPI